jgi:transcriptional regulator with XRE-family HTH domain
VDEVIYKNILALCKERNITISKLEKEVGLGNGTIGRWERVSPTVENAKKVADFFGVTVDSLMISV